MVLPREVWLWYLPKTLFETMLSCSSAWHSMNTDDGKRENASLLLLLSAILKIRWYINKNRELKQWGRERKRERYKAIDLLQNTITSCGNATARFIGQENKRNVGKYWTKSLTGFKLDWRNSTYANIVQHSPTCCTIEHNIFCPTCCVRLHGPLNYFRIFSILGTLSS